MALNKDEALLLDAIRHLGKNAYGVPVLRYCQQRGRHMSLGRMYSTLERLEENNIVHSRREPGGAERGFKPKRYYFLGPEAPEEQTQ